MAMLNALEQNKQYTQTQQVEINNLVNVLNTNSNAFAAPSTTSFISSQYPNYVVSNEVQYQSPPQQQQQFVQQQMSYPNVYNYGNTPFYMDMPSMQQAPTQPVQTQSNLVQDASFSFMQTPSMPLFYASPPQMDYGYAMNNNVSNYPYNYTYSSNANDLMQQHYAQQQQLQQLQQQQQQLAAQQYQVQFESQVVNNNNNSMSNNATNTEWANGYVQHAENENHGNDAADGQIEYESEEYEEGGNGYVQHAENENHGNDATDGQIEYESEEYEEGVAVEGDKEEAVNDEEEQNHAFNNGQYQQQGYYQ
eukprot:CAMPEP_0197072002 /NCGR_PEP_ID=MMETSP1384-20130603/209874_1 /TAXON_ID=29189 /ORGANISM="Ammonia sp." /LENGTH=306 /DNA_ID=CAMNT_0042510815 /DNA_START=375 /DNA_END=1296 /DNA_ORIENTATION=-